MDVENKESYEKRVRKRLTIAEKLQIIEDSENGMRNKDLAEKYKVHHSTITLILANKKKLLMRKENIEKCSDNKNIKRYSQIQESIFEKSVYEWYTEKKALGEPVSGLLLRAIAKDLHERFYGETNFLASEGWLYRFKKRHGIRLSNIKEEKHSAADEDAIPFQVELKEFVEEHEYEPENIYNADESSLFWKQMPNETLACRPEAEAPYRKVPKDRVTIQISNASGSRKIPLKLIGKKLRPPSQKFLQSLDKLVKKGGIKQNDEVEKDAKQVPGEIVDLDLKTHLKTLITELREQKKVTHLLLNNMNKKLSILLKKQTGTELGENILEKTNKTLGAGDSALTSPSQPDTLEIVKDMGDCLYEESVNSECFET